MWREDDGGFEFSGPKEAFLELRQRARDAIAQGDSSGHDLRELQVRLRDDANEVLFEGTLDDAASLEIDGRVFLPKP